jgi:hypothetical protein
MNRSLRSFFPRAVRWSATHQVRLTLEALEAVALGFFAGS